MTYRIALTAGALALGMLAAPAPAQDDEDERPPPPPAVQALYDCQDIADPTARLACYDQSVKTVEAEARERNIIITDRERVREARRGLFGLGTIRLGIFGGSKEEEEREQIQSIDAEVREVGRGPGGKVMIVLADGVQWIQTDGAKLRLREFKAKKVHIERGPLGSYVAELEGGTPFRVKRIN